MAVSGALRRLLGVRSLEEEQHRLALESAVGELRALEEALNRARARAHKGRARLASSAADAEPADRIAALVETEAAARHANALRHRIAVAEERAVRLRAEYLEKRVERRQAETLIRESEAQAAVDTARRGQQNTDDWFSSRNRRTDSGPRGASARPLDKKL